MMGHPPFFGDTPYDTYKKVVEGKVKFSRSFPPLAAKFVRNLLTHDRRKRLGCGKGGAKDVMNHKWLKGLDWEAVGNKQVRGTKSLLGGRGGEGCRSELRGHTLITLSKHKMLWVASA